MVKSYALGDLPTISKEIIEKSQNKIVLFYGKMGVGKTTLIKEIVKQLGSEDNVSSPTFSLVNEYYSEKNGNIYHFDFYRIKNEEEAFDIGIEEYFYSDNWCLIEWPDKVKNLLPLETVKIVLKIESNQSRKIELINEN